MKKNATFHIDIAAHKCSKPDQTFIQSESRLGCVHSILFGL